LDLIHRSSRARYPLSPACFFRLDSLYISRIFKLKNRPYLGFHALFKICMYYTSVGCQGVERLGNQGMRSLLCITW
jgi:hypothetical protein